MDHTSCDESCTIQLQLLSRNATYRLLALKGKICRPCEREWKYREYWDRHKMHLDIHSLKGISTKIEQNYFDPVP